MKSKNIHYFMLSLFMILFSFLYGGYYNFVCSFSCIYLIISLIVAMVKNNRIYFSKSLPVIGISLVLFSYLPVSIWAVDSSTTFMSFTKPLAVLLFLANILQLNNDEKQNIIKTIPISAFIMSAISLVFKYDDNLNGYVLDKNNNLSSFFQYANTYAVFILIALVIVLYKYKNVVFKCAMSLVFLSCIYLTNSRSVCLLTVLFLLYFIYDLVKKKSGKVSKILLIIYLVLTVSICVFLQIKFNFFTNILTESSFNSRLFYYKDALKMIVTHPFGSGVNGFYYMQPKYQSANYYSMYVHNDYLNLACDVGIIPAIIFIATILYSIVKNNDRLSKLILLMISLHILIDFDMQYACIFMIFVFCIIDDSRSEIEIKSKGLISFACIILCVYSSFFGYVSLLEFNEKYEKVTYYYPHTTALLIQMSQTNDSNKAYKLANEILDNNKYIFEAHHTLANIYIANDKPIDAMNEMETVLEYDRLNSNEYDDYIEICYKAGELLKKQGDEEHSQIAFDKALRVSDKVKDINSDFSKRAYYLKNKPDIRLSEKSSMLVNIMTKELYGGEQND